MAITMDMRCPDVQPVREHEFFPVKKQKEWGEDQEKLQQLMMRSVLTPRGAQASCSSSTSARDLGDCYDFDENIQTPSGWERCLDLESGRLYLVKSTTASSSGPGNHPFTRNNESSPGREPRACRASEPEQNFSTTHKKGAQSSQSERLRPEPFNNPRRVDGSADLSSDAAEKHSKQQWTVRWLQGKEPAFSPPEAAPGSTRDRFAQLLASGSGGGGGGAATRGESSSSEARNEAEAKAKAKALDCCDAGLDLGLNLSGKANEKRVDWLFDTSQRSASAPSSSKRKMVELQEQPFLSPSTPSSSSTSSSQAAMMGERRGEQKQGETKATKKTTSTMGSQELATDSAMVTAGCSRCLMYVLLWKANPTCPRCGSPILLDFPRPAAKRTRLDIGLGDRSQGSFAYEREEVVLVEEDEDEEVREHVQLSLSA